MARGKLTKLKSAIKRWQSAGNKVSRGNGNSNSASNYSSLDDDSYASDERIPGGFHPVYVGKSRRRYLINSDVIVHPLVQELVDKSDNDSDEIIVGCEVVLFEHLLWMIQHADPQPESSLDELAEYYAC